MGHPWELTLSQLLRWLRRERGIEVRATVSVTGLILRRGPRMYALPGFDENEPMPLPVLEAICRTLDLPGEDLGLDPRVDD